LYKEWKEKGTSDELSRMFSETEPGGTTVNILKEEAKEVGTVEAAYYNLG